MNEPQYLYHYTNFDGLKGIFESKNLWFSDYRSVNDFKEFKHSEGIIKDCIEDAIRTFMKEQNFKPSPDISQEDFKKKMIEERNFLWEKFLEILREVYLLCFCVHTDSYAQQNGLLSMWCGYGQEGGYALVFDREKLMGYLKEIDKPELNYPVKSIFKKVTYLKKDDPTIPETIRGDYNQLKELLINRLIPLYWEQKITRKLTEKQEAKKYMSLLKLVSFIKHGGYREELEYRLCLYPMLNGSLEERNEPLNIKSGIRKRKLNIISYIEFPLNMLFFKLDDFVKEIIIGPQQDMETKQKLLKSYLKNQSLSNIIVRESKISYRP
jgi:hypothetical protein